jgi:acetylornithine deacetylase/succinyl-diaminopimelate desuccinylase-like protein
MTVVAEALGEGAAEEILRRLLAVPSVQTNAFESDPAVLEYLRTTVAGEADRLGLPSRVDEIGNVIVEIGPPGGAQVALFAYAMTHPANRMQDAFVPTLVAGDDGRPRLRGRGAAEQKGPLAAALMAAAAVREREGDLAGRLILCVSPAGETGRHDAARAFMAGLPAPLPEWCIVAIGTENAIGIANKGRVDATIVVRGSSVHSSVPWQGRNAIEGALEVLRRLRSVKIEGEHARLGNATLTPTAIRSWPEATHTVPDEVRIVVDRRLLMYPSELAEDAPFVSLLRRAFADVGAGDSPLLYSHGCIDAGFFNSRGVPAVMLGPGEQRMWHTDDESVALDDVSRMASVYAAAALQTLT